MKPHGLCVLTHAQKSALLIARLVHFYKTVLPVQLALLAETCRWEAHSDDIERVVLARLHC